MSLLDRALRWAQVAADFRRRHARGVVAAVLLALGGFGAVAVAVAPLAPDAAELPQRVVVEAVDTVPIAPQLDALAGIDLDLHSTAISRPGDSIVSMLRRLGVMDSAASAALARDPAVRHALSGRPGRLVQARSNASGGLLELVVRYPAEHNEQIQTHFSRLTAAPFRGQWVSRVETVPLSVESRMGSGTIRNSLFGAADEARIPDAVATQLAEIFSSEIDFHRELRKGDTFSVVYEAPTADGEPIPWAQGTGRLLAAEFVNGGRVHQAIWFQTGPGNKGEYFDAQGRSRKRAFLASPLEFSRVTSGFAMRMHPILQRMRAHKGVDYGAPAGTPVRVVGDGVVEFAGSQSGYGNVVEVRHSGNRSTLYAHLSRVDVRQGQRIEQGQTLGAVGATGWATGPHLHFEFRVAGEHQDPLQIARAAEQATLDAAARTRFADVVRMAQARLDVAESIGGVRAKFE
jgi:murein DD-endopeptidase MepM/ murein hydrolase activator NlpD